MRTLYGFLPVFLLMLPLAAAGDAAKGKEFFAKKCKACHAEDGSGAPAMKKKFGEKLKPLGSPEIQGLARSSRAHRM